jgi:hypothetical protein
MKRLVSALSPISDKLMGGVGWGMNPQFHSDWGFPKRKAETTRWMPKRMRVAQGTLEDVIPESGRKYFYSPLIFAEGSFQEKGS